MAIDAPMGRTARQIVRNAGTGPDRSSQRFRQHVRRQLSRRRDVPGQLAPDRLARHAEQTVESVLDEWITLFHQQDLVAVVD
jgi:hypothetical protein